MAEYITADRWLTGVETHKTKRGRILCTGVGCVGCFPEDFPELARELEVYDNKTALLFGESWSDDDKLSNEGPLETESEHLRSEVLGQCAGRGNKSGRESSSEDEQKNTLNNSNISTGDVNLSDTRLFLTEYIQGTDNAHVSSEEYESSKEVIEREASVSTKCPSVTDKSLVLRTPQGDHGKIVYREDCVCLFFALEYYRRARTLPDFSILEIVDALTTLMHINEIKSVQRFNGMWHIVLRTREYLSHLLKNGVDIRGRWFQIVQDNNMYCDKVR